MSKRRTFTPEFKARVVLEELTGVKDKNGICREYQLKPQVFSHWREEFLERAPEIFATQPSRGDEQARIAELERMVGRLTMQLEAAKESRRYVVSAISWPHSQPETGGDRGAHSGCPHHPGLQCAGLCQEQLLPPPYSGVG